MDERHAYRTKQRTLVERCMSDHSDEFLTVEDVYQELRFKGASIGRTTIYRALENAVGQGVMAKVVGAKGDAARYRRLASSQALEGQLSCIGCGKVLPLDCSMLQSFSDHVKNHHGFSLDQRRTVLYGLCPLCSETQGKKAPHEAE